MALVQDSNLIGTIEDPYESAASSEEQVVSDSFAASAMGSGGNDPEPVYNQIQDEYRALGSSPTVEAVRGAEDNREALERNDVVHELSANPTSTPEQIEYAARAAVALDQSPTDLMMSYSAQVAAIDLSLSGNERQREDDRADPIYSRVDQLRAKAHLLQREVYSPAEDFDSAGYTSGIGASAGAVVDFLGAVLPFNEAKSVYAVARAVGLDPSPANMLAYGNLKKKVIRKMKSTVGVEREVLVSKAKIALQEHSGYLGDNHFLRKLLSEEFTVHMDDKAWWHVVDNLVGVIDVLGVTQFGAMTAKQVARSGLAGLNNANTAVRAKIAVAKGSPLDSVKTANPHVAAKMATDAILDESGQVAKKMGTTREKIIEDYAMPNIVPTGSKITVVEGMPSNVLKATLNTRAKLTEALHRATPDITNVLTKAEITAAKAKVLKSFESFFKTRTNTASSNLEILEDKMTLTAQFQADEYGGWKSIQDLFDDVTNKKGAQSVEDVTVWHRATDSDDYIDVTNDLADMHARSLAGDVGDFTYSVKFDIPISPEWKHALPDDAVIAGMGWFSKYMQGAQAFNKDIRSGFFVAVDKVGQLNKDMGNAVKESFSNVGGKGINLYKKNKDYDAVIQTLQEGAIEEKWYNPQELLHKGFTENQMTAYYGFKEVSDAAYQAAAHDMWKTLNAEGMSSLTFPSKRGDEITGIFGRGLSVEEAQGISRGQPLVAYNPVTGKTTRIGDSASVAKLYGSGKRIATPRGGEAGKAGSFSDDGQNFYNYLIVNESQGARIEKLTQFPTPYRDGHYFRSYTDDNFIIRYTSPNSTLNGVTDIGIGKAVGVVKNRHQAELFIKGEIDRLGSDIANYEIKPGAKWHEGRMQSSDDWDLIQAASLNSNRARGEHLRGLDDKLAQVENPIDSLGRTISAVSSRIGKRDVVEANQQQWVKTYGEIFDTRGWPSGTREELKSHIDSVVSGSVGKKRQGKEALAYYDYIVMNKGIGAPISDKWRSWVFHSMSNSDSVLLQSVAPSMAHLAGFVNPALKIKQSAFLFWLAWNPIKQLILQPSQIVNMISTHPKYMGSAFVPELSALTAEAIGGKGGVLGKQLLKELDASGIAKNIDHHQWINQSQAAKLASGDAVKPFSVRQTIHKIGKVPQKMGFEAGEKANQVMHWLVARNEYKLANPGADLLAKKHSDQILARSRDLSGSMNAAGKFGYQGWGTMTGESLSAVMQFMSHSHKMLQMIVPQKIGGARFLTPAQKTRLAVGNTALAGAGLWPFVNALLDHVQAENPELEMGPDLNRVVQRGLIDHTLNKMIGVTFGEDVDIQFASAYTPTGGIEMFASNIYQSITNDPMRQWDFVAGIGAVSSIAKTIEDINTFWRTEDELYDTPEKIAKTMIAAAELSSGVSNARKAYFIHSMGKVVSKNGTVQDEANFTEMVVKVMGLPLGSEGTYRDLIDVSQTQRERYQSIQTDVRQMHRSLNRMFLGSDLTVEEQEIAYNSMLARWYPDMNDRVHAYKESVKLRQKDILDGVDSIALRTMTKAMSSGDLNEMREVARKHPRHTPAIGVFLDALTKPNTGEQ